MAYGISQQHEASTTALGGNVPYRGLEWHSTAEPDYLLYVFNCSARTFCDPGDARKGIIGRIKLRAEGVRDTDPTDVMVDGKIVKGNENQRYSFVTSFPQPILMPKFNDESGEIETKETDVRRFVVDMISPDNLTYSLDVQIDPAKAFSIGNDYSAKGIFFSYSNPPAREDVQRAYMRMEMYYKQLNEKAATLDMTDKLGLQQAIASNPDHVYAANYYGKAFPWAKKEVRPVECPNCGEQKAAGRKFHQTSFGVFCVEPTVEAWKAVVNSGMKRYEDVPDDFKWKKEPKTA
jgi:hypothetical protein